VNQQSKELMSGIKHHLEALEKLKTSAAAETERAQAELLTKVKDISSQQKQTVG